MMWYVLQVPLCLTAGRRFHWLSTDIPRLDSVSRVAVDRGLRLAEKRQLPLGRERRQKWLDTRDQLYEEIQVCGPPRVALSRKIFTRA